MDSATRTCLARLGCLCVWLGVGQFVVLTAIAMADYPGGQPWDSSARGYSFWHNTLSDLGKPTAANGLPNPTSSRLFLVTGGVLAVSLLPLWLILPWTFGDNKRRGRAVRVLGTLSAAGTAMALCTPGDRVFLHGLDIFLGAVPGLAALLLSASAMRSSNASPKWLLWATIILLAAAGSNVLLYATHFWMSREWIPLDPVVQKLVAIYALAWMTAAACAVWGRTRARRVTQGA